MNNEFIIGVLGGMGTQATIHLFQQYASLFPAEKEWDRPRIIIDNRCTMPSRVRAYLYNENVNQLVEQMTDSLKQFMNENCTKIILDCNTSHLFLPFIYEKIPELEQRVVNIINCCVDLISNDKVAEVYILGTEGTVDSGIYQNALEKKGVKAFAPSQTEYHKLRSCIEAVKQNVYTDEVINTFLELVNRYDYCILGCTELPILYEKCKENVLCKKIYDPLYIALQSIHDDFLKVKGQK